MHSLASSPRFPSLMVVLLALAASCASPAAQAPPRATASPGVAPPAAAPAGAPAREPTTAEIFAASRLPGTVETALAGDAMNVTVHRLSNGMTVYISRMPAVASVRAWTVIRAGSRNDPADATGLAHYLEHMLFKGTSRLGTRDFAAERPHLERIAELYRRLRTARAEERDAILTEIDAENQQASQYAIPGEMSALYQQLGISSFDAFTWFDVTAYIHEVPANLLGVWATAEAERYQAPTFRQFYSELESVYEERNMRDVPERRIWDEMLTGLFPDHPYGTQTTIGKVEHLKTPRYDEMIEFHRTWYVPNDMAIVLVGDVEPAATVATLEQAFAGWKPRPLPTSLPGRIAPLSRRVDKLVVDKGRQSVTLAWQLPRGQHDAATWDVIAELLGGSRSGLLQRELVLTQKLPSISVAHVELQEASFFMIEAPLAERQTHDQAERLILEVVHRLAAGDFSEELVARVALNKRVAVTQGFEDPDVRVSWLADIFTSELEWQEQVARVQRYGTIGKPDIVRETTSHLGSAFVAVRRGDGVYTAPRVDKPKITPVSAERQGFGAYAQSLLSMPVPPLEPRWLERGRDYEQSGGAGDRLVTSHNGESDLFEVTYLFDGGTRKDLLLCYALDALDLAGSRDRSAADVQDRLYGLAATVSGRCDSDKAYLSITGIDANFEATLALVRSWLEDPRFTATEVKPFLANKVRSRRESFDQKEVRHGAAREYLLWGRDSPYLTALSNRKLLATTPVALGKKLRAVTATAHDTWYFGPRSRARIEGALALGRVTRAATPTPPRRLERGGEPEILFVPFPSAEARVYLSIPADAASAKQRAMASLFSSFAHPYLWEEIREARGLAYSVGTWFGLAVRKSDDGGVQSSVACQADKLPEMLRLLLSLYADFKPSEARFETARASLEASYRAERARPRDVPALVYGWYRLGFGGDPRPAEWAIVRDATLEGLTQFSLKVTRRPHRLIVIGDPARVDLAALGAIAPVRQLAPESLFSWGPAPEDAAPAGR